MRKILLSTLILASFAGHAFAADLPSTKSAPVLLEAPFSWNGWFVGAQVGGLWGQGKYSFPATGATASANSSAVFGGGFAGYNFHVQSVVLGLQGEINAVGGGNGAAGSIYSEQQTPLGSVDARLGYAFGRTLFYAIGGVAFTNSKHGMIVGGTDYSFNFNRSGFDIGGGLEYAFANNWTARIEYRHYDFGSSSGYAGGCTGVCNVPANHFALTQDSVRVGLAYRFGPAPVAPVVAKY